MLASVITRLKTGSIKNVVRFPATEIPKPRYLVVRLERDPIGRGEIFRIIGHAIPGDDVALRAYMRTELFTLLDGATLTTAAGRTNRLELLEYNPTIIGVNDDQTISMERLALAPGKL